MLSRYRTILLLPLLTVPTAHALEVRDARTPEPPQGAPVLAGYMHLHNPGEEAVVLEGATSADFARVELHDTEVEDDTARMFEIEEVEVPPHGHVAFEPRGKHLMLYTPERDLRLGDVFTVELELSSGKREISFTVVERDEVESADHADHGETHGHDEH